MMRLIRNGFIKHIHHTKFISKISLAFDDNDNKRKYKVVMNMNAGIRFYESSNKVILSKGINGIIPLKYIIETIKT
jgi:hypothetical protein